MIFCFYPLYFCQEYQWTSDSLDLGVSRSGSIEVNSRRNVSEPTGNVEIVSLECPSEIRIPGELWCSVFVNNSLGNEIDVVARIRMDGELIDLSRTLGNTNPTLNTGKDEFRIGINIDSELAQYEFNYNSFLDFLDSKITTRKNCGHGVTECQVFKWLPTPHDFTIEIYKGNQLLDSIETTVTLTYGNYYEKKSIEYYVVPPSSGATAGAATALAEISTSAGISAAEVGAVTSVIVEVYNILKQHLWG